MTSDNSKRTYICLQIDNHYYQLRDFTSGDEKLVVVSDGKSFQLKKAGEVGETELICGEVESSWAAMD